MAYKIQQTDSFRRDLDGIISYMLLSLENRIAAASLLKAIESCYENLESTPFMYESCHDPYLKALGYRRAVIRGYILVYKVIQPEHTVFIMRLFHGRQDYEKLI